MRERQKKRSCPCHSHTKWNRRHRRCHHHEFSMLSGSILFCFVFLQKCMNINWPMPVKLSIVFLTHGLLLLVLLTNWLWLFCDCQTHCKCVSWFFYIFAIISIPLPVPARHFLVLVDGDLLWCHNTQKLRAKIGVRERERDGKLNYEIRCIYKS